jgi:hypothetical protein
VCSWTRWECSRSLGRDSEACFLADAYEPGEVDCFVRNVSLYFERPSEGILGSDRDVAPLVPIAIEQAQILTTHNLAVLFDALPLQDQLAPHLRLVAETCFRWTLGRLRLRTSDWHQTLANLKNAAYAWRQLVFYLSFASDVPDFLRWGRAQLESADDSFRQRFEPAIRGLELAARGIASRRLRPVEVVCSPVGRLIVIGSRRQVREASQPFA